MSGSGPSVYPGDLPKWSVFKFPPDPLPPAIPPPFQESTFRTPFPIPANLYNAVLDVRVPLTIASVYAVSVSYMNWYNRKHGNKAWPISKTRAFKAFVVLHNIFLAIYSAVTFVAMVRALKVSLPHYSEPNAVVGAVDALCKIQGPRGLGDAAYYNVSQNQWTTKNRLIHLDENGLPDNTDVGRIWNEGLAFWGWIFYLSKFYEVLDTMIIIMKGKRSTTLQTYHHSGAMLSMWAGMRYMSPPIWMFALVNSGIHAMMVISLQSKTMRCANKSQYTYYTVSAFGVRVPQSIKRTLTTMQITQFLVGVVFASIHLFISYTVPVAVPYTINEVVSSTISSVSSVTSTATSSAAIASATGAAVAFLKKLVYRAAGEEGLAENINHSGYNALAAHAPAGFARHHGHAQHPIKNTVTRTIYRTEYQTVPCIDTSGQAFAVYLNLIYLAPLTGLFMRFFVKSYLRRTSANTKHTTKKDAITKSGRDAIHGVDREIESLGKAAEDGIGNSVDMATNSVRGRAVNMNSNRVSSLSPENEDFVSSFNRKVSQRLEEVGEGTEATKERARQIAKEVVNSPNHKENHKEVRARVVEEQNQVTKDIA
jgi:hypothetical protein